MSNFPSFKSKVPYTRDVYLAYAIEGAERTPRYGYPIIPKEFCYQGVPAEIAQWDRRSQVSNPGHTAMSFYCKDEYLQPVLSDPKSYVEKLRKYECVIGMDCSPFDNMPPWIADHQIGMNLAITYFFGKSGLKVVPNVRIGGTEGSVESLLCYPKGILVSIGTNGFTRSLANRQIFTLRVSQIVNAIRPAGILVYGPVYEEVFATAKLAGTPVYRYDSFMQKRSRLRKQGEEANHERE
ncbi:MAG: DUF4417 domain-containing protein [Bacillales bacterium]|nr:DUF4417 domain-containing protein [Bacillales bacterium]MDY5920292.1 DUF4417 domain-containing protein [Candidatus Enteromonas sp.]